MTDHDDGGLGDYAELADMVRYEADSVVSRVLQRDERGVMTLFAFAEGQGLTEHSTPHEAAIQVLEGEVSIEMEGEVHRVKTGNMQYLPAGVPHTLLGGAPFKMLLLISKEPR